MGNILEKGRFLPINFDQLLSLLTGGLIQSGLLNRNGGLIGHCLGQIDFFNLPLSRLGYLPQANAADNLAIGH